VRGVKKERGRNEGARVSRRRFVVDGGLIVAGAALGLSPRRRAAAQETPGEKTPEIPRKVLGRTGIEVSILGLGTALLGHQNDNKPEIPKLVGVFSEALDRGINYVDTARMYGGAEPALKEVLRGRREKVVVATKVWAETAAEAEKLFHESLQTMALEHVDILHLHSAGDKDMDKVLGKGGSWEFLQKAKAAGKTRFLGMTGHSRPANFLRLLETGEVDVLMVALNFVDRHIYGFEDKVLPAARKQKTGILAMKVYGGVKGGFRNYPSRTPHPSQMDAAHHARSVAYAKSLEGVTGMVIGVHSREQLLENIQRAVETPPLSPAEFAKLCEEGKGIAAGWQPRFGPAA
jgi:predicted aldo/keto reductase-like oxidoreductase